MHADINGGELREGEHFWLLIDPADGGGGVKRLACKAILEGKAWPCNGVRVVAGHEEYLPSQCYVSESQCVIEAMARAANAEAYHRTRACTLGEQVERLQSHLIRLQADAATVGACHGEADCPFTSATAANGRGRG